MKIEIKNNTSIEIDFLKRKITICEWKKLNDNIKICIPKVIKYGIFSFVKVLYMLLVKKAYYEYLFSTLWVV
ncbi:MAG: hypothetical protein QXL51_01500 [Candidatus Aenigmatarchaeota archaeon]